MRIKAITWAGIPVADYAEARRFLGDVLGLQPWLDDREFAVADLPSGDRFELFGPSTARPHMTSPIVGFLVEDVDEARAELEAKGVEFLEETGRAADGNAWAHFRGPGGWLFELTSMPGHPAHGPVEP